MQIIDLHQDLQLHQNKPRMYPEDFRNQTSFGQLEAAGVSVVVASGFGVVGEGQFFDPAVNEVIEKDFEAYRSFVKKQDNWRIITNQEDVRAVMEAENQHGIILHVEGLNAFSGKSIQWQRLEEWYALGWRSVGIVWNKANKLGGGTECDDRGLTDLGREFLQWAQARSMIIDLAHMNPPTFSAALAHTSGPVVVSHANAQKIRGTARNYNDDQLRAVARRGGVVGVFFSSTNTAAQNASINDVVRHIDHLVSVMGIDHIALGTDFGGLTGRPIKGLNQIEDTDKLKKRLHSSGYDEREIAKIWHGNARRVLRDMLSQ